jgi:hypothetical protein
MMFALAFIHRFEAGTRPGETPLLLLHGSDHFRLRTIALVERSNHRSAQRIAQMITRFVATSGVWEYPSLHPPPLATVGWRFLKGQ